MVKWKLDAPGKANHGKKYNGLAIVVHPLPTDPPGVFWAVPVMDNGPETRVDEKNKPRKGLHLIMPAHDLLVAVEGLEWWVNRTIQTYQDFFEHVLIMGREHAKFCEATVRATLPVPHYEESQLVFAIITFEKRGLVDRLNLVNAETRLHIGKKMRQLHVVEDFFRNASFKNKLLSLHSHLPGQWWDWPASADTSECEPSGGGLSAEQWPTH